MKLKLIIGTLLIASVFASCDDTTGDLGSSLIDNKDKLHIQTDTFNVTTRSIVADSVLSRNTIGYLGKVKDPQTGSYITGDFMTQFHIIDNYSYPVKDSIRSLDANKEVIADSCEIRLYYSNYYGDSLATMKLSAYEMAKPMKESGLYYSNFNPKKEGYIRNEGIKEDKVYTLYDQSVDKSTLTSSNYMKNIRIKLDKPYTDKSGKTYNNYGTYIMQNYYKDPSLFTDSYSFINNLCPGFYFEHKGGLGSMGYISVSQLNIYFRYSDKVTETITDKKTNTTRDTVVVKTLTGVSSFSGTEEVLQTTNIGNSKNTMKQLAADKTCTYLKTPSGIFTEITLPIEEIMKGHENDTLNTAKIVFTRLNENEKNDKYSNYEFKIPQTLLLIPASDLYSFFEEGRIANNKTSFLASYNSSYNTYTFNNIAYLVKEIAENADRSKKDWNKLILVPVTATYNNTSTSVELVKVSHDMSMCNTRLVGGENNPNNPVKISVIYAKFNTEK